MNRRTEFDFAEIDRMGLETDEYLAGLMARKSAARGLVNKTFESSPQPRSTAMDPGLQKQWDDFVLGHIRNELQAQEDFSPEQRELLAFLICDLRAEWRKEIAAAANEVRAELERAFPGYQARATKWAPILEDLDAA